MGFTPESDDLLQKKYQILGQNADANTTRANALAQDVAQKGLLQQQTDQSALNRALLSSGTLTNIADMKNQTALDVAGLRGDYGLLNRGLSGASFTGFGLPGFQDGGRVKAGEPILVGEDGEETYKPVGGLPLSVGEQGPEAIVPPRDGAIIPNPRTNAAPPIVISNLPNGEADTRAKPQPSNGLERALGGAMQTNQDGSISLVRPGSNPIYINGKLYDPGVPNQVMAKFRPLDKGGYDDMAAYMVRSLEPGQLKANEATLKVLMNEGAAARQGAQRHDQLLAGLAGGLTAYADPAAAALGQSLGLKAEGQAPAAAGQDQWTPEAFDARIRRLKDKAAQQAVYMALSQEQRNAWKQWKNGQDAPAIGGQGGMVPSLQLFRMPAPAAMADTYPVGGLPMPSTSAPTAPAPAAPVAPANTETRSSFLPPNSPGMETVHMLGDWLRPAVAAAPRVGTAIKNFAGFDDLTPEQRRARINAFWSK